LATFCRLEIGDTAGWKPVGNLRYAGLGLALSNDPAHGIKEIKKSSCAPWV